MTPRTATEPGDHPEAFHTTHWSVVLAAAGPDSLKSREAWEKFAQIYWPPVYAFIRGSNHGPGEAQDLAQEFFVKLIDRRVLNEVVPGRERFRSFLLVCLKHFLTDQQRRFQADRRRHENNWLRLDVVQAEAAYHAELVELATPESLFERRWAATLLDQAVAILRAHYAERGKQELFAQLVIHFTGEPDAVPHAELAARLQTTESAIKNEMFRLRQRLQNLFREQVAATVPDGEVDEEMRHVLRILAQ